MKRYSIIHGLLAAAVAVNLALPAAANGSSFSDISDNTTALNADILRLMGVVSGTGGNQFNPNQTLTRAQFCTMVVNFMGMGDQVVLHSTRTIFTDVTSKHWARGYVNLAASTMIGGSAPSDGGESSGSAGTPLIAGVGDGRFLPDEQISFAQAVTILIRVLNYSSDKVGAVWPDGYLNLAQSIGLDAGMSSGANASLTRAQAAQLFVNALKCKTGDGKEYYTTLGETKPDTVLLAVNTQTDDGSSQGAVRTSSGTFLPDAENVAPTALVGHRGVLVLNEQNEIVTFVPDDSDSVTITLVGNAEPSYLSASGGKRYTIAGDTPIYTADSDQPKSYSEGYGALVAGSRVTLFTQRGKVVAIYASSSAVSASGEAMVVTGPATAAAFHKITGGAQGYSILKNQQSIALSDIQPYDVVTYDSMTNTLIVSDLRLTCLYENPAPNPKAPTSITLLGHQFPVLESAWDFTSDLSVGQSVSLLLTADGKVAGIVKPGNQTRSTAIGVVTGANTAEMFLPAGGTIKLEGKNSNLSNEDYVVTLSSSGQGKLSAARLSGKTAPGSFDPTKMTLGGLTVAPSVRVYEQVSGGAQAPIPLSTLDFGPIPASQIATYHQNTSGVVDIIILNAVTGDAYTYGRLIAGEKAGGDGELTFTNRTVQVENSSGGLPELITGTDFKNGAFGGVVKGSGQIDGTSKAASVVVLDEIKNVKASDFFERDGRYYVTVKGHTYLVSSSVECYKGATKDWFAQETGSQRLSACLAFSGDLSIYVDPVGEKVRIVTAH